MGTCLDCKKAPAEVHGKYCVPCWHRRLAGALLTVTSFSEDSPVPYRGGYRMAFLFDGEFVEWLCEDVHETEEDARECLPRDGCPHGMHYFDDVRRACIERRRALRDSY